jgi:hypothetical protein
MTYVTGFLTPVKSEDKARYVKSAETTWPLFQKYGALSQVETWGEDVPDGKLTSFPMAVKLEEGEVPEKRKAEQAAKPMGRLDGHVQGLQKRRMQAVVQMAYLAVFPVSSKQILGQIIAAYAKEINFLAKSRHLEQYGWHFQHDAQRDFFRNLQMLAFLIEQLAHPANFAQGGNHRDHELDRADQGCS